jgi:hypothetical protein
MSERLDVDQSETYTVESGTTEEWLGTDVDGTLDVDGELKLIDDAESPERQFDAVGEFTLPLNIDLQNMQTGTALFLVGIIGVLGGIASALRNYAAIIMIAVAGVSLVMGGLFEFGLEIFWVLIILSFLLIAAGMAVRWSR